MKKLTIITALLIASYSVNANAKTYYVGISSQKNRLNFNEGYDSINNIGYDDISSELSGFIGYEYAQSGFSPYQLSIETSYFTDKNSLHSRDVVEKGIIIKSGVNTDIRTSVLSLNTINHYHIHKRVSIIGILGLNYANFKLRERATIPNHNVSDSEDGFGINYGIGLSFNPAELDRVSVRAKIVRSVFNGINPNIDSINKINGMTAISIDFMFNF